MLAGDGMPAGCRSSAASTAPVPPPGRARRRAQPGGHAGSHVGPAGKARVGPSRRRGGLRGRAVLRDRRRLTVGPERPRPEGGRDHQAAVVAAEAEAVRQRRAGLPRPRARRARGRSAELGIGLVCPRSAGSARAASTSTTAAASSAPAAPSAWPVTPLVDVTGGPGRAEHLAIASASAASLSGVDVPWALMWTMSAGRDAGVGEGQLHAGDRAGAARATAR